MSVALSLLIHAVMAEAPYCPPGRAQAECDAVWAAAQAYANTRGSNGDRQAAASKAYASPNSPPPAIGTSVRSWHPDQGTTCTELQTGSVVRRSVSYVSNDSAQLNTNPSDGFWEAMGCTIPLHAAEPATWDSVFSKIDQATAIEERRKARAAAKGIRLCERAEFLANSNECLRRARLADSP